MKVRTGRAADTTTSGAATMGKDLPRPPLKWAGGKRWQIHHLLPLWQPHRGRRLVEPFCGGLAVALGLMPTRALLNDVNPHLINFYRWLQRGLSVNQVLRNEEAYYYWSRQRFNELIMNGGRQSAEAATLFYYLNRTGYNGLCRFNRRGQFNVPFGRHRRPSYKDDFLQFKAIFKDWEFTSLDFNDLHLRATDFVYADPPYDVEFTNYSQPGFTWENQVQTAVWLAAHRGPVVLTNQATPRVVRLYRELGYKVMFLEAPRRINRTGDRTPAPEVLATRNI